jgi:uncharacterized protein (TIRG00374 family)
VAASAPAGSRRRAFVFSWKWQILLTVKGVVVSVWNLLVITLIGKFWGTFLPSSIGVDIVRGYYLYRERANGTVVASSLIFDKVMGLWSLLLLATIGLLVYGIVIGGVNIGHVFVGLMVLAAGSVYLLQTDRVRGWIENGLPRVFGRRVADIVIRVYHAFLAYRGFPSVIAWSFVLSIILQLIRVLGVYAMARALDVEIPLAYYLVLVPVSMILIMLPLSVGGLGLREGVFVGLFAHRRHVQGRCLRPGVRHVADGYRGVAARWDLVPVLPRRRSHPRFPGMRTRSDRSRPRPYSRPCSRYQATVRRMPCARSTRGS